tara:strand:+ start:264 stop:536 length:273 start_codon:yes stop_codon:yes gene_type:complete
MNVTEFKEMVADGKIFTVEFIKKDGTLRKMNARLGVKKHLKGGTLAFDPSERNLLPVFDMQKEGYRMINASTILNIKIGGKEIILENVAE